uniref:Cnidarian restricted protein n=1 Tax=Clytia hemisphaerica TaxID=252671 RepID=A0A7M5WJ08_9CNID|eukprot:TCONS_00069981-protein
MAQNSTLSSYVLLCMVLLPMFINAMPIKWLISAPLPEFEDNRRELRSVDELLDALLAADDVKRALSSNCDESSCGQYVWGKKRAMNNRKYKTYIVEEELLNDEE